MAIEVRTKKELAIAIKNREKEIIICDPDLAKKVIKFKGRSNLSLSPATGTLAGIEIVYIVALIVLGVVVLYSLYKDYDVEVGNGVHKLILKKA